MKKENLVKIALFSRKLTTAKGVKFTQYSTRYAFKNEDGTRTTKYINVVFTQKAFDNSPVKKEELKRGYLIVEGNQVNCPDKFVITKDEKTGKDVYPVCKIFGGIREYVEILKDHEFHFDADMDEEDSNDAEEVAELTEEPNEND